MFVKESYLRCLELENRMYRKHLIHFEEARNKDLEDVLLAGDEEFKDLEGYAELKAEVEKERADKALAATLDLQTLLRNEREKGRAEGRQMALDEAEKKKRRSRRTDDEKDEDYQPVAKRARKPKAKQAGGRHAQVGPAGAETVGGDTAVAGTNVGGDDGSGPAEIRDTM